MLDEYWSPKNNQSTSGSSLPSDFQNTYRYYYAGFLVRVEAFFGDGIIIAGSVIILGIILFVLNKFLSLNLDFSRFGSDNGGWIFVIAGYLYFIILTYCYSATLGKRGMGLKVLRRDFSKASFAQIILRELFGRTLSHILFIGYLIIPFNKEKRALHDFIAGTIVVRNSLPRKSEGLKIVFILLGVPILLPLLAGLIIMVIGTILSHFR